MEAETNLKTTDLKNKTLMMLVLTFGHKFLTTKRVYGG